VTPCAHCCSGAHLRMLPQRRDDAELAVNGMRRRKYPARRLLAEHILLLTSLHDLHSRATFCGLDKIAKYCSVFTPMPCPHLHQVCGIALAVSKLAHAQLHVRRKAMNVLHQVRLQRSL
jgi:hypothetical protein